MKVRLILSAILFITGINPQYTHTSNTSKSNKAYSAELEKLKKNLSKAADIIKKPCVNTKKLRNVTEELRKQENILKDYDGKLVRQPQSGKEALVIEVRDPSLDPEDDPVDYIILENLLSMFENMANTNYMIGLAENTQEAITLKQKELSQM